MVSILEQKLQIVMKKSGECAQGHSKQTDNKQIDKNDDDENIAQHKHNDDEQDSLEQDDPKLADHGQNNHEQAQQTKELDFPQGTPLSEIEEHAIRLLVQYGVSLRYKIFICIFLTFQDSWLEPEVTIYLFFGYYNAHCAFPTRVSNSKK